MLTITFSDGSMMFLNIASPHTIYIRTIEQKKSTISPINGISNNVRAMINGAAATDGGAGSSGDGMDGGKASTSTNADANGAKITPTQLFAQSNGQIVELCGDRATIKSVWEYFLERNSNT